MTTAPECMIPGGDDLLRGWTGPLVDTGSCALIVAVDGVMHAVSGMGRWSQDEVGFDPARPEVRDLACRWLEAGEQCPKCDGTGEATEAVLDESSTHHEAVDCQHCTAGYLRPPADMTELRALDRDGKIPAPWVAALVSCAVARARAGMPMLEDWVLVNTDRIHLPFPGRVLVLDRSGAVVTP